MKNKIKIDVIFWRDAFTFGDWTDQKEMEDWAKKTYNEPNMSVGKIVKETKKYVVIASSLTKTKNLIGDITMIPRSLIVKEESFSVEEPYFNQRDE